MKQIFQSLLGFFIFYIACVDAEIRIEITQGINNAKPIAIVPFKSNRTDILLDDIGGIIASDLRNSGKFNPINPIKLPQQPTVISEIIPNVWISLGINIIVIGSIQLTSNNQYIINYQLVDVVSIPNKILIQKKIKVSHKLLRYAAHTISDEIFEKLTNISGVFRNRISYVVKTNHKKLPYELRVSDYDGYNQCTIHRSPEPLMSPSWSSDGKKIAYVTFENGNSSLVVQTISTGEIHQITAFPNHNGAPIFSPDGNKIAFVLSKTGSLNIYIMDLYSSKINQVTDSSSNNTEPSWMPDNKTIIYTSDQSGRPQIYKLNINGGIPERITWEGNQNQNAVVSSNGKFIVMVTSSNNKQHIAKQDLVTGNVEYLTNTFLDETPSIAPNGTMVIYSTLQGLGTVLQLTSIDGRFKSRLPVIDGNVKFPSWSSHL
ncbi:MAG: Tol-Pal system beta propeller repeat protein TolB [Arsenophonus endosymbiont of Ceratovacuna japonica]